MSGVRFKDRRRLAMMRIFALFTGAVLCCASVAWGSDMVKKPNVAGSFYPADPRALAAFLDDALASAKPPSVDGNIRVILVPHAGYEYSGKVAAVSYALIKGRAYSTVVVVAPSHHFPFNGASVYSRGAFETPLGRVDVDEELSAQLIGKNPYVVDEPRVFEKEHALEVQIPFLQKALSGFKIVPIIMGDCSLDVCRALAGLLKEAIGERADVLVVISTDLYHGNDFEEARVIDEHTLAIFEKGDPEAFYSGLKKDACQMCGGLPAVMALYLVSGGEYSWKRLMHTDSAEVTGQKIKGSWTVGYASYVAVAHKKENMLSLQQRRKLLAIARSSIDTYLRTGEKLPVAETDPVLNMPMGAFVTLTTKEGLRGCIGNLQAQTPLVETIRDMAVEAATADPRFPPVTLDELNSALSIEISALSPLRKVGSADEIVMGTHGVVVRKGFNSGVYLPQVATETGWSKEYFLSSLCSHKAGLPSDAWKDKATELYVFTAEVFSEQHPEQ
jgi:MEMO1 family protein